MSYKPCPALFCFLLLVIGGCNSKSDGNQPSAPAYTPSAASTSSTSAADNKPTPESGAPAEETAANPAIDACALLEKSEIASVQGQQITEAKLGSRDDNQFAISQCFYMAAVYASSVSLEVTERNPKNPDQNAVRNFWKERFRESREQDEEEEREAGKPRLVTGLGDEAYWIGNDKVGVLYALKKNRMVRISIGGPGDVETRLAKSKTLAAKALNRLK